MAPKRGRGKLSLGLFSVHAKLGSYVIPERKDPVTTAVAWAPIVDMMIADLLVLSGIEAKEIVAPGGFGVSFLYFGNIDLIFFFFSFLFSFWVRISCTVLECFLYYAGYKHWPGAGFGTSTKSKLQCGEDPNIAPAHFSVRRSTEARHP